jgi:hypothetical protein
MVPDGNTSVENINEEVVNTDGTAIPSRKSVVREHASSSTAPQRRSSKSRAKAEAEEAEKDQRAEKIQADFDVSLLESGRVTPIVNSSSFSCYRFPRREDLDGPRKFRAPTFASGKSWPSLPRGKIKIDGLQDTNVFVLSLQAAKHRRQSFAKQWAALDLDLPAVWVKAVDGLAPQNATPFRNEVTSGQDKDTNRSGVAVC